MRIHFGIKQGNSIKWPERCLWCDSKIEKWHAYRKKTTYDFQYRILWTNILSRIQTIYYPICKKHNYLAHILRPARLLFCSILIFILVALLGIDIKVLFLPYIFIAVGYFYFRKYALIVHNVGESHIEISIPDGKYANEFGLLNNCNSIKGHILMQG